MWPITLTLLLAAGVRCAMPLGTYASRGQQPALALQRQHTFSSSPTSTLSSLSIASQSTAPLAAIALPRWLMRPYLAHTGMFTYGRALPSYAK